jgi:hypothetical protein
VYDPPDTAKVAVKDAPDKSVVGAADNTNCVALVILLTVVAAGITPAPAVLTTVIPTSNPAVLVTVTVVPRPVVEALAKLIAAMLESMFQIPNLEALAVAAEVLKVLPVNILTLLTMNT